MARRTTKIRHDEETRAKIQAAQIINRLHKHVMGEIDLVSTQVSSAKTLLDKVLPDLKHNDNENTLDLSDPLAQLIREISGQGGAE